MQRRGYKRSLSHLHLRPQSSMTVSGQLRDPHILRGEDGRFYMVATDGPFRPRHGSVILIADEEYETITGHDFGK